MDTLTFKVFNPSDVDVKFTVNASFADLETESWSGVSCTAKAGTWTTITVKGSELGGAKGNYLRICYNYTMNNESGLGYDDPAAQAMLANGLYFDAFETTVAL